MSVKVYTTPLIDELLSPEELTSLKQTFKDYKTTGDRPPLFGVDRDYRAPPRAIDEELHHIHLFDGMTPEWVKNQTSDKALVYCPGYFNEDDYLLIAILHPDAHKKARDLARMRFYCNFAEQFRFTH